MTNRRAALFVCLVILASVVPAIAIGQTPATTQIGFGVTGETWASLSKGPEPVPQMMKLSMLRGVYDGVYFGGSAAERLPRNVTVQTLMDGLDQFYGQAMNRQILIVDALQIIRLMLSGRAQSEIDQSLRVARCRGQAWRDYGAGDESTLIRRLSQCG